MTTASTGTKRRTLLQRGAALLTGGAALAGTTRWAGAASPPAASPPSPLTLYARARPVAGHHHADGRIVASGDLLDAPDGTRIGTFYANCFCLPTPFGPRARRPRTSSSTSCSSRTARYSASAPAWTPVDQVSFNFTSVDIQAADKQGRFVSQVSCNFVKGGDGQIGHDHD